MLLPSATAPRKPRSTLTAAGPTPPSTRLNCVRPTRNWDTVITETSAGSRTAGTNWCSCPSTNSYANASATATGAKATAVTACDASSAMRTEKLKTGSSCRSPSAVSMPTQISNPNCSKSWSSNEPPLILFYVFLLFSTFITHFHILDLFPTLQPRNPLSQPIN